MPVSVIDPGCALVVVDLQKGLAGVETVHPFDEVVTRSASLAQAFRDRGLPVVLVTASGRAPGRTERPSRSGSTLPAGFSDLLDALHPEASDLRVDKQRWGAFVGTGLDDALRARGVTQVVVTGVATSAGVESTARSAYELGYHVVVVTDAVTDTDGDAHTNSVERIFPKLGERTTTAELLDAVT